MHNILVATVALPAVQYYYATYVDAADDCYGRTCKKDEYCSSFNDKCESCAGICDSTTHNYHEKDCQRYCPDYGSKSSLEYEIEEIKNRQIAILILISIIVCVVIIRYAFKLCKYLRNKGCFTGILKGLKSRKSEQKPPDNGLPNLQLQMPSATGGIDRAPSQIYSVTGVEGSVLTVTTPISTRHPAEDSTTETDYSYSYDNAALQVTPVSDKPSSATQANF